MNSFLKIALASFVGGLWYSLNGEGSELIALGLFVLILFVFFIRPVSFQDPEKREEYIQRLKSNHERKIILQNKQKEEQMRLYQAKKERESKQKQELKEQMKKYS
ncbi:hypothetical protein [Helicobacter cetorum]|uniref:Integral membrane protein n=1 Tax=Helicobacter cetorum (strain ATCC BAA-540 / CCUG 52418 / MIT 99-5656) TaxID=1163745 RepID=I0ETD2_HELCM|nr:hypothetical protein [Helicobacter cetorum]AFI06201.1 integral membrane protein [Helicobacter cetorum MIT 99-5656]